jgi:hypothetical protein
MPRAGSVSLMRGCARWDAVEEERPRTKAERSGARGRARVAAAGSAGLLRSGGSADGCGAMVDALAGTTAVGALMEWWR